MERDPLAEVREDVVRHEERWQEHFRWKTDVSDRLNNLEGGMEGVKVNQATTSAEMKAEVRWSSFFGTMLAAGAVGLVLFVLKLIAGDG